MYAFMSTAIGVFRVDLNGCLSVRLTFCLNFRFEIAKTVLRFDIPALSRSKRPFSTSGVHTVRLQQRLALQATFSCLGRLCGRQRLKPFTMATCSHYAQRLKVT